MNIGWPEGIWFGLAALALIMGIAQDGEPKTGKHSLTERMLSVGISFGLLYWGGFFS
jgi:hypothetical protein